MKHSVHHGLGKAMAKQVTTSALETYKQRFADYKPTTSWLSEDKAEIQFTAKGFTLKGTLEVGEQEIEMELQVPFLLKVFQGQAMGVIEGEIKAWIEKAKNGQL